jgi:hypothetical protein
MKSTFFLLAITLVLMQACQKADVIPSIPKLKSVTSFIEKNSAFRELDKTVYEYDNGSVPVRSSYSTFDVLSGTFVQFSETDYHYTNGRLADMEQRLVDYGQIKTTRYEYKNNTVSKIFVSGDVSTTVAISYKGDTVQAFYSLSNGRFFTYKFSSAASGNVQFERTIDDSNRLASEVTHDFDDKVNPYSLLGFVDPYFTNYSRNNKLKTSSHYYTSFPTSVPVSYEYEYDARSLPLSVITTYVSYPNGGTSAKLKVVYEYE